MATSSLRRFALRFTGFALFCALTLVTLMLVRTFRFGPVSAPATLSDRPVDARTVAAHLGEAVRYRTVSQSDGLVDLQVFEDFQSWIQETYPSFSLATTAERFGPGGKTVVRTWPGRDPNLAPVLFIAHADVVPVEEGTEVEWTWPPFSGKVAPCQDTPGDCVWGRGTIDIKGSLVATLEAAEALAATGWAPTRTLVFLHGQDEESGGFGSQAAAQAYADRGARFAWSLDEGLVTTVGIVPGISRPVALVGIAEKGYLSVELTARGEGGHSSMPGRTSAAGDIARAVARLEAEPPEAIFDGPAQAMFESLGGELAFGQRLAFANSWLLGPVLSRVLAGKPTTATLVRTTQAVTILDAGTQDNVLPQRARAVVNYRLHPRDSIDGILARVRRVIDDPGIEIKPLETGMNSEPSPVASTDAPGYEAIYTGIRASVPDVVVAPGLFIAVTDTRPWLPIVEDSYRYEPYWMTDQDRERIHGTDERVRVENLEHYVRFYDHVIRAAGG
jgi:carboxypeptidase PM20D1